MSYLILEKIKHIYKPNSNIFIRTFFIRTIVFTLSFQSEILAAQNLRAETKTEIEKKKERRKRKKLS